ncbi:hypothetical protein EST38_g9580 [Candolleomyces aberdarensis]|uniref:Nephrocystin 3-like N-terminal domain-containing protein n=1 Tax=Candolleomyces aberdarensis TaxID=2316362 RepID=A0A4Q2DB92_9AGAR|nr:hypothetical protein EST38_g9580 [Candolleomyces aberdarensis]
MQNTRIKTTIHHSGPPRDALDILLANSAPSATYNSKDRSFDTPKCDEDTRVGLIEEIMNWAQDPIAPSKLLCMTGSAGSGKSALAQTISETCGGRRLGASFFFSVIDPLRNNPDRFVASLAYQISRSMEEAETYILRAVEKDPAVFEMSLETQAEVLLINPVLNATRRSKSKQHWIIVVDGLDECKGEENQAQVLRVLHTCVEKGLPFRVFITSRPEYAIRSALESTGSLNGTYHIILNDLRKIGRAKGNNCWPPDDLLEILVEAASGQFVYAATLLKFVGDRRRSPFNRLQIVVDWVSNSPNKQSQNPFASLDALYTNILSAAQTAYEESFEGEGECLPLIKRLMSYILINDLYIIEHQNPINPGAAEYFLKWEDDECNRIVEDLHSVIQVQQAPGSKGNKVSFYHKSFLDYLLDSSRCRSFHVSPAELFADLTLEALRHVTAADLDCKFYSTLFLVQLVLIFVPIMPDIRVVREQDWSGVANPGPTSNRFSILKGSLITALLAWPHFLPLALAVDPDNPVHDEVCEAVARL